MRRRGKAVKTPQRPKTLKRRNAPKGVRRLVADKEPNVEQLTRELAEAREREAATAEVLQVISGSPAELEPVFETILANATRLCDAKFGTLNLYDGNVFRIAAVYKVPSAFAEARLHGLIRPHPGGGHAELIRTKRVVHIKDIRALQPYREGDPAVVAVSDVGGARTIVLVPMLKDDVLVGVITIFRQEVRPFTNKQIDLVSNFAKQAIIAIENTRLLSELRQRTGDLSEALDQQTATSEVLKVISSSSGKLEPVFQTMLANATRICEAAFGSMLLMEDNRFRRVALHNAPSRFVEFHKRAPVIPLGQVHDLNLLFETKRPVHIADAAGTEDSPIVKYGGARTLVIVPMLKQGEVVGAIGIYRQEVRPFTDKQIELVTNFAAQAVIAIENARLLNELHQRTDDLSEALEYQTATSEVLNVISRSPTNAQPVFDAICESASRLCEAVFSVVWRYDDDLLHYAANHNFTPEVLDQILRTYPKRPDRSVAAGRAILDGRIAHVPDMLADPGYAHELALAGNWRASIAVPMLCDGKPVGAISVGKAEAVPFSERQMQLLSTFADQAVIAIENVRLFNETQEALDQQTASSEVLKIISSSPGELKPVFESMLENATRICEAKIGILFRYENGAYTAVATLGVAPAYAEYLNSGPIRPGPTTGLGRVAGTRQTIHVVDTQAEGAYTEREPLRVATAELGGARSLLNVPMLKEGELIGAIGIYRQEVRPFTDKQIELVTNFAAQAVIAIENARLLNELRESLEQQTATADVLKVISSSPGELEPVFQEMLSNAMRICEAKFGILFEFANGAFRALSSFNLPPAFAEYHNEARVWGPDTGLGRLASTKKTVHVKDTQEGRAFTEGDAGRMAAVELGGVRTFVAVPMLKEGELIGAFIIFRQEVRPFTDKQIELVNNFAAQAVIAIENARLLSELRQRTTDLTKSLEELRTTQDRLVQTQKLALLGQLTAGIAHEIKNPLNFVNNFSGMSAELIGELQDTLKGIPLDDKARTEINELTDMLKSNFNKVVHHGRRADVIVKNMLQHSREGSGEHRVIDINALVEESLNLAWHGARAETQGFEIKLTQSFDPSAGGADVFPQDIRRALLNLIANGFYAATRRRAETNGDYEPTLTASTKNLGDRVEIRIRDNGTGMTPEVKEKMFEPFFTTKPTGEGTGLGLSISHDIIVKQHAGAIDVDTQPGEFTEVRVILPRSAVFV
jgi:two-component system NtrC family sensor kinase